MHPVEPKVFLVAETTSVDDGFQDYLAHVGAEGWTTDARSSSEWLIEAMGRLCYRSWKPGMNANVTKVREGNDTYLANILSTKHGSVLEHASVSFIFADVSRVFTHELVRHRAGVAISQESLRYVRLTDLGQWLPTAVKANPEAVTMFENTFSYLERLQIELAKMFRLDDPGTDFTFKKVLTSAMRRIAPIGLATTIGWTANMRALRWVLELRTAPTAEEEIRLVFGKVGEIVTKRYPNLFSDFECTEVDGLPYYRPKTTKV